MCIITCQKRKKQGDTDWCMDFNTRFLPFKSWPTRVEQESGLCLTKKSWICWEVKLYRLLHFKSVTILTNVTNIFRVWNVMKVNYKLWKITNCKYFVKTPFFFGSRVLFKLKSSMKPGRWWPSHRPCADHSLSTSLWLAPWREQQLQLDHQDQASPLLREMQSLVLFLHHKNLKYQLSI